ncbi:hypothetical protein [Rhizobium deserti]|uniref:hypothetical protein n=1 Tax=Rhizobium deserti TaxID=2547961 RepID=UPI00138681CF|nr:hypothetical protein [Rhizobium deserti]
MQTRRDFFPHILFPDDLSTLALAQQGAMARTECADLDPNEVARIVLHFYRMGLVEEKALSAATGQVAALRPSCRPSVDVATAKDSGDRV